MIENLKEKLSKLAKKIETLPWYVRVFIGSWLSLYTSVVIWFALTSWNPIFYENNTVIFIVIYIMKFIAYIWLILVFLVYLAIFKKYIQLVTFILFISSLCVITFLWFNFNLLDFKNSFLNSSFGIKSEILRDNLIDYKEGYPACYSKNLSLKDPNLYFQQELKRKNISTIKEFKSIYKNCKSEYGYNSVLIKVIEHINKFEILLDNYNSFNKWIISKGKNMFELLGVLNKLNIDLRMKKNCSLTNNYFTELKKYIIYREKEVCVWISINDKLIFNFIVYYIDLLNEAYEKNLIDYKYKKDKYLYLINILSNYNNMKDSVVYDNNKNKISGLLSYLNKQ